MKKFFALMLLLMPLTLFTACGNEDGDEPDSPKGDFELPILKWGSTMSYIKSHQDGKIIETPEDGENGYAFKLSGGKTWGMIYLFDYNNKLYASGMLVETKHESDFFKWFNSFHFEDLGVEDYYYSEKYNCIIGIEYLSKNDTKYNVAGIQTIFVSADYISQMGKKEAEKDSRLMKVYLNRDVLLQKVNDIRVTR